jgi:hypothetical protein
MLWNVGGEGMFYARVLCLLRKPFVVLSERDVVNVYVSFNCNYVV